MVVNSFNFLLFFIIVFIVYYLPICRTNPRFQNIWLFLTSYFFYGFADWKMIPLLLGSTIIFYGIGIWLKNDMKLQNKKRASNITTMGVILGICVLLYFKYLNFFAESFAQLFNGIGLHVTWTTLNIILPIGVSFFTFKLISYIIEIHREHIEACNDFIEFGTYIAFFPTILSGPIDRPIKFIPQLQKTRLFNYDLAIDGFRQILWGMFTKMCIADSLNSVINEIWGNLENSTGSTLTIAALLYAIQMYTDFDGYSNMAIGVGKLLGINVTRNFNHPLLARNTAEYWRRWHMSLTTWITDYVYMPLNIAFRNYNKFGVIIAVIINLVIIGLWHGANWTFGLFGLYHGILFIPLVFLGVFGNNKKLRPGVGGFPQIKDFLKMIGTFILVSIGLIIFKADNIQSSISYFSHICSPTLLSIPSINISKFTLLLIVILFVTEWYQRDKDHPLQWNFSHLNNKKWITLVIDYAIIASILFKGDTSGTQFIYFQF